MNYFDGLGLNREPFSNSPDPDLFYRSKNHMECLQQMEIAVRLRRGLNVVTGDVGAGKTTLCRQLIRVLGHEESIETFLLLDPYFKDPLDFLRNLNMIFGVPEERIEGNFPKLKENLREFLRQRGEDQNRIITLIVDEGQKITGECMELLRELLNFETNAFKLLQIIIFAQKEFDQMLKDRPNLADRVNFHFYLEPLDYAETKRMIETRLGLCSKDARPPELFTGPALWSIYRKSQGFPRKIVQLCHKALLLMAASGKKQAGYFTIARAAKGIGPSPWTVKKGLAWAGAMLWLILPAWIILGGFTADIRKLYDDVMEGRLLSGVTAHEEHVPAAVVVAEPEEGGSAGASLADKPLEPLFKEAVPEEDASQRAARLAGLPAPVPAQSGTGTGPALTPLAPDDESAPEMRTAGDIETPGKTVVDEPRIPAAVEVAPAGVAEKVAEKVAEDAAGKVGRPAKGEFSQDEIIEIVGSPAAAPEQDAGHAAAELAGVGENGGKPAAESLAAAGAPGAPGEPGTGNTAETYAMAEAGPVKIAEAPSGNAPEQSPPGFLGSVPMQKGWVVSLRAAKVYGSGGKRILSMFSGANPEIENLDQVRPGQSLHFPAIVAAAPASGSCLVRVGRTDALDMAFAYLSQARANWPELTLFAHFNPAEGLIFDVVLDKIFADRAAAGRAAAALPADLAGKAVIVESFEPGTVFYTDLGLPEPTQLAPKSEEKAVAHNDSVNS